MANARISTLAVIMLVLAFLVAATFVALGTAEYARSQSYTLLTIGGVALVLVLVGIGILAQIHTVATMAWTNVTGLGSTVTERLEQFSVMLNLISEQQLLSERAKTVAFRDKDREVLNRAIREEIARGQHDAALLLVNDMEATFGYKLEAEQLRAEISGLREGAIRRLVSDVTAQIDRACASEKWDEAIDLANRLCSMYPDHELCRELPEQIRARKETHKQALLARWRDVVARKDIDSSVDVLRQLDMYLTSQEVAQVKDGALELFKARIERLRERFKNYVQEKRWQAAISIGEDIIAEFPTSKLAQEVREIMKDLQARAAEPAAANT